MSPRRLTRIRRPPILRAMRDLPTLPILARTLLVALALVGHCATSLATEAENHDPITRLLADKAVSGGANMVVTAMNFLGVPYRRGGSSESAGFDCSGFTRHIVEASLGTVLPRRVDDQAKAPGLVPVKRQELRPGDLVFFNTLKRTFSHVGIYVGEGKFIHAPRAGGEVRVEDMGFKYWAKRFTGARRIEAAAVSAPIAAIDSVAQIN
jgi:cell wall-associated NlpC family hydrolase